MFIELAEHVACPVAHAEQSYCVLMPDAIIDRIVKTGTVACPQCRSEFPIEDGVVQFGDSPERPFSKPTPDAAVVQALLDLAGPGGYVVLVGSAGILGPALGALQSGVHMVCVNGPREAAPHTTRFETARMIPVRTAVARGAVIGAEYADEGWLNEAARVVMRGRRLVVLAEAPLPEGVAPLAAGDGMVVGVRGG